MNRFMKRMQWNDFVGKRTLMIISILTVLILVAGIGYANRGALAAWGFEKLLADEVEKKLADTYAPLPNRPAPDATEPAQIREKPFSVLLMGVDARNKERGRSDTLIYTVIRPEDGRVLMVSLPRDTYADMAGKGFKDKIAHAYAYGGPEMTVESVEQLLQSPVDHYASINFQGFIQAVDLLGGISLPITEDIVNRKAEHEKFTIKANQSSYSGQDALNYVRYREDAGGDISRTERTRQFLEALIRKAASMQQWDNIPEIMDTLGDHFRTDIRPTEITTLVKQFIQSNPRISSYTLKGAGKRMGDDQLWYYVADPDDLEAVRTTIANWLDTSSAAAELTVPTGIEDAR